MNVAALLAALRRVTARRPATTTITVTRVVGSHPDPQTGEPVEDTVTVTTDPEPDPATLHLAQIALVMAALAAAAAVVSAVWRTMRSHHLMRRPT